MSETGSGAGPRFEVIGKLGAGGQGEVLRVRFRGLNKHVALKYVSESHWDRGAAVRDRGDLSALLSHPNIVQVLHIGREGVSSGLPARASRTTGRVPSATLVSLPEETIESTSGILREAMRRPPEGDGAPGKPFILYELVEGRNLDETIPPGGLPLPWLLGLALDIFSGLAHSHRAGILHLDLKPANILVTKAGVAKIADFGLGCVWPSDSSARGFAGTPSYAPPETIRGESPTPAADVYAAGVTLFRMATGQLPFVRDSLPALFTDHRETPPPDPCRLRPDLPPPVAKFILHCLEKSPQDRPADGAAAQEQLVALMTRLGHRLALRPTARPAAIPWSLATVARGGWILAGSAGLLAAPFLVTGAFAGIPLLASGWLVFAGIWAYLYGRMTLSVDPADRPPATSISAEPGSSDSVTSITAVFLNRRTLAGWLLFAGMTARWALEAPLPLAAVWDVETLLVFTVLWLLMGPALHGLLAGAVRGTDETAEIEIQGPPGTELLLDSCHPVRPPCRTRLDPGEHRLQFPTHAGVGTKLLSVISRRFYRISVANGPAGPTLDVVTRVKTGSLPDRLPPAAFDPLSWILLPLIPLVGIAAGSLIAGTGRFFDISETPRLVGGSFVPEWSPSPGALPPPPDDLEIEDVGLPGGPPMARELARARRDLHHGLTGLLLNARAAARTYRSLTLAGAGSPAYLGLACALQLQSRAPAGPKKRATRGQDPGKEARESMELVQIEEIEHPFDVYALACAFQMGLVTGSPDSEGARKLLTDRIGKDPSPRLPRIALAVSFGLEGDLDAGFAALIRGPVDAGLFQHLTRQLAHEPEGLTIRHAFARRAIQTPAAHGPGVPTELIACAEALARAQRLPEACELVTALHESGIRIPIMSAQRTQWCTGPAAGRH